MILGSLDGAVELGSLGRQHEEVETLIGAGLLEDGLEIRSAVDLDAGDRERGFRAELVEQDPGGRREGGGCDVPDGPFGDGIPRIKSEGRLRQ